MSLGEFGPFSMTEVRSAFNSFDLDKNKFVGAAELRHVFKSIGEDVTDEEVDEMIRMVDLDGDGQISFPEFSKMVFRYAPQAEDSDDDDESSEPEVKPVSNISAAKTLERKVEFEALIDQLQLKDKIKLFCKRFEQGALEKMPNQKKFAKFLELKFNPQVEKMFLLFDPDKNGVVNANCFMVSLANFAPDMEKEDVIKFAFTLYDTDKSGDISMDELLEILMANYMAKSPQQVQKKAETIMRQADTDNNQRMNFEEFLRITKQFPNLMFPGISFAAKGK